MHFTHSTHLLGHLCPCQTLEDLLCILGCQAKCRQGCQAKCHQGCQVKCREPCHQVCSVIIKKAPQTPGSTCIASMDPAVLFTIDTTHRQYHLVQNPEPSDNLEKKRKKARPRNEIIVKTKFWFISNKKLILKYNISALFQSHSLVKLILQEEI